MLNIRKDLTTNILHYSFEVQGFKKDEALLLSDMIEKRLYSQATDSNEYYYSIFDYSISRIFEKLKKPTEEKIIDCLKDFSKKVIQYDNKNIPMEKLNNLIDNMFTESIYKVNNLKAFKKAILIRLSLVASHLKTASTLKEITTKFILSNVDLIALPQNVLPFNTEFSLKKRKVLTESFPEQFKR